VLGRVLIKPRGPLHPSKAGIRSDVAHVGFVPESEAKKSGRPTPGLEGSVTAARG
jgi:hypothetical protein